MTHDVSVVGLYILDILGRPVQAIPEGGNVDFIEEIRLTVAGTAGGTAVDCAKLGLATAAVGAVGDDEKAHFVIDTMNRYGIDTSMMQRIHGVPTSSTMLNIRPDGERPALHQRGASDHLIIDPQLRQHVLDADFVHMGGTGLLASMDGAPTTELLRAAKERGCTTTFDLIAASAETLGLVESALPYIDYFMPSIEEARAMSGRMNVSDVADYFLERGARTCVFTCGSEGSYVANTDARFTVPAFAIDVTDTTGCGDAYAGFIAGLRQDWDLERCARFANAASALVATGLGSDAGITDFEHTVATMESLPMRATPE